MPAHLCDAWDAAVREVFETGEPKAIEFSFDAPDGPRAFSARLVPERGAGGEVESVLGVAHDVTERKHYELALKEADRRKDEFLATLAHELRNPLAPIRTGLELLRLAPRDPAAAARALDSMDRQLAHLVRLVDDLLDVSRISRGKVDLRRERVTVQAVVEQAVEASRPHLEAAGHALSVRVGEDPLWLDGDLTRLVQVVSNLLHNAAKYTPRGGRIDVSAAIEDGRAVLRVRDDGMGIPAAMLPRVFDLFTQVDRTLERAQGGLGIGLSLARRLVEMHGGTVEAHSEGLGRGSTFTVRLPLAAAEPISTAPQGRRGAARTEARRVLVVDDNDDAAEMLAMVLELGGHEPRTAHDGPEALETARAFRPEVVFLDIGLPGMDGFEVARRLRQEPGLEGAVLVALTGWGSEEDRKRTREAGFDFHLTKPVDNAAVLEVLSGATAGRGARRAESACP